MTKPFLKAVTLLWWTLAMSVAEEKPVSTFSIVGFDPKTGDLGVAVQSKFFGVGSVVPYAKAGVGAVATQSYANVGYGPEALKKMSEGVAVEKILTELTSADDRAQKRQVAVIDAKGKAAAFTGDQCHDWAGHQIGKDYSAQGNLLASEEVVTAMGKAFREQADKAEGELADWLLAALEAGQAAGGDKRGRQSAALLVVREKGGYGGGNDRFVDLRTDDHPRPIEELARLLKIHKTFYRRPSPKKGS